MTIAYLIDYNPYDNSGVIQKIKQQSLQWTQKGYKVYLVSTQTMSIYDENYKIVFQQNSLNISLGRVGTAIKLFYKAYFIYALLHKIEFDLIYMRYRLYMPFFKKLLKKYTVIMEINSDDTIEYKLHSRVTDIYNRVTRDLTLKYIDAFVSVSYELKDRFTYLDKPVEVIANGIDSREYHLKSSKNNTPTLVFIGTPKQSWHGMDKILQMAEHFKNWQFYIIGTEGKDRENIRYFGYLLQKDATKIIEQCDIGIGTLSLYKNGLNEASPLKTRQYLACGLPVIYAYRDTDIDNDAKFGLRLDNCENNIEYTKIKEFINYLFNNQELNKEAREFAVNMLDYSKKECQRLDFFQRVLDEK